jgi:hypothetical protein
MQRSKMEKSTASGCTPSWPGKFLNCDRVLYAPPSPPLPHKRGRHRIHGDRFAFKEPETWGAPAEVIELEDPHLGKGRLERWSGLHEKKGADVPYEVLRACVHLECEKPPQALWLAWLPPVRFPAGSRSRPKPSGSATLLVGRWKQASIFAKKPWDGPCLAFRPKKLGIAGPN